MGKEALSDEDQIALKQGLGRLRKARQSKPVGFWYCQEAFDGLPRLLVAAAKKKVVPPKLTAPLKRSAKKKGRICQGTAWRDSETRQLRFEVVHGGFNDKQFQKDLKKLGQLAKVPIGRVSIGVVENDRDRSALGREMLAELDEENAALRQAASELSGPEALAALAGIEDLSEEERLAFHCGAGAKLCAQAQSRTTRFKNWILRRDDPDPEPTVADLWAFHQQNRSDHLSDRAPLAESWAAGQRTLADLGARRDAALPAFEEACTMVEEAKRRQADGTLPERDAVIAHRRLTTVWPPLFQQEQLVLIGLDGLSQAGESLTEHLQEEIDYDRLRQQDLAPVPRHAEAATGWREETEAALAAHRIELALPRPARPDGSHPRKAASLTEIALRLTWPIKVVEKEASLRADIEALGSDPNLMKLKEVEAAAKETEAAFAEADGRRAACLRTLNDLRAEGASSEEVAAAQAALEAAEAACDAMTGERKSRLVALQEAEEAVARLQDRRSEMLTEMISLRADQKRAAVQDAAARLDRIIAESPELSALDSALSRATDEEASAREALEARQLTQKRQEAEVARLQGLLSHDDRPSVYADAREACIAAEAALKASRARLDLLLEDLPEPVPDELADLIAAARAEEAACAKAAEEAEARRGDARIGARAAELDDRLRRLRTERSQLGNAAKDVEAEVARLEADIAGLKALAGAASDAERPQLLARIKALTAQRTAARAARKRMSQQRLKLRAEGERVAKRREAFLAENGEVLAAAEERQSALREEAGAALVALQEKLEETRLKLTADETALQVATGARESASKAMSERVKAGPPKNLDRRMAHLDALEEQAAAEEARESTLSALQLQRANKHEVMAIKSEALARLDADREALSVFSQVEDSFSLTEIDDSGQTLLERLRAEHGDARIDAALAARDAITADIARLKALGEPIGDCLTLLAPLPRAFWPDELVAEAQDYARISALFEEETAEEQRARETEFREKTVGTLSGLGVEDALAIGMDISNLYLCDADAVSTFTGLSLDTSQGWKLLSTVGVLASTSDLMRSVLAKGASMPEGVSDVELRLLREELSRTGFEKARAMLPKVNDLLDSVDFALTCHKDSVLELLRSEALASHGGDVLLPGPGVVFGLIRSGIAVKKIAAAQKKTRGDSDLLKEMKETSEDELLIEAMENRTERSRRDRNTEVVDGVVTGANFVATAGSTVGGFGSVVAAGAWAVAATVGAIKSAILSVVDWKKAAKLKDTMKAAVGGSRRAMRELFRDHQKFATMLMVMRARDGNAAALKFCVSRGLHTGEVLDGAASLKLLRQLLLKADGQGDERGKTFTESCVGVWDAMVGMGRKVKEMFSRKTEEEKADLEDQRQDDIARDQRREDLPDRSFLDTQVRLRDDLLRRIRRREGESVEAERAALEKLRAAAAAARGSLEAAAKQQAIIERHKPTERGAEALAAQQALLRDLAEHIARIEASLG